MHKSWLVAAAVATTATLFMAPSAASHRPATQPLANTYADWLVAHVGKQFYLSADRTIATEKSRTSAMPVGADGVFTLAAVHQDFAYFDNKSDRVCVPLTVLRTALAK